MILYKEKHSKKITPHKWFAWFPVWAWNNEDSDLLSFVWLENIIRKEGYSVKYSYYIKYRNKKGDEIL